MSIIRRIKEAAGIGAKIEPDKSAINKPLPAPSVPSAPAIVKAKRPVNELIWHCAATPEGRDYTVKDITAWHRARGWSTIGYHYVVYRDGSIKLGRAVDQIGAHVEDHNVGTIGAVYIGGLDKKGKKPKDTRTPAQREAMLWLTRELAKTYGLAKISGHNQYAQKACPSFDVRTDQLGNIPGYKRGKKTGA
jgi:N-acetylmuramoyl-L-alanine amidase